MKVTMITKDHIARKLAEAAWNLGTSKDKLEAKRIDDLFRKLTTVSDALSSVGDLYSPFDTIRDLATTNIFHTEEKLGADGEMIIVDTGVTYFQALREVVTEAQIAL